MEMDRFLLCLSALCVVYAAETTLDLTSTTSMAGLVADTDVTQQLITTTSRTDKKNPPNTDSPLENEIEVEERATSATIRTTEETSQVKELPTTKLEFTTSEAKESSENDVTTTAPPAPVQVTERSSLTTEAKEAAEPQSVRSTTPPPTRGTVVTATPSTISQRPTNTGQKKNKIRQKLTTTTAIPPVTEEILQQRPAAPTVPQQVTTKPTSRPNRKSSVEAKKGTINGGALQQTKRRKPSKKDNGMSSLVYIPLMIQAQMIPMMLMQLKFFALKALALGKLAMIILGFNLLRNAIIGYHNDEQQYEQESLASAHYGYNGGPEYGSWVNRRMFRADPVFTNLKESPEMKSRINNEHGYAYINSRLDRSKSRFSRSPYRGYENQMEKKIR